MNTHIRQEASINPAFKKLMDDADAKFPNKTRVTLIDGNRKSPVVTGIALDGNVWKNAQIKIEGKRDGRAGSLIIQPHGKDKAFVQASINFAYTRATTALYRESFTDFTTALNSLVDAWRAMLNREATK